MAAAALFVLVAGFILRPRTPAPVTALPEPPSSILREAVTSREPPAPFAAFQTVAERVVRVTVRLHPPTPPPRDWSDWKPAAPPDQERYGVLIGGNRVLGRAADLADGTPVGVQFGYAGVVSGWVVVRYPRAQLALVALEPLDGVAPPPPVAVAPRAGDVLAGIAPGEAGPVIVPLIVTDVRQGAPWVSGDLDGLLGMPVFTSSGEWVGSLAAGPSGWTRILTPGLIADQPADEPPLPAPPPIGWSLRGTGEQGIVVVEVMPGSRAARSGIRADDVLVAIGGKRPATLDDAVGLLSESQAGAVRVLIRRAGRQREVRIPAPSDRP